MSGRPPLDDSEVVLRRYDPENRDHFSIDQQTGEKRLRSTGLRFDDYPSDGIVGCSVFRHAVLEASKIARTELLENLSWQIVAADVKTIRDIEQGGVSPQDAVEDPFPEQSTLKIDIAHGLITLPIELGRNTRDKLIKKFARDAFEPTTLGSGF